LASPICKFGVSIFPAGALAGKARSKVFEKSRTELDQVLALYSLPLFFLMLCGISRRKKSFSNVDMKLSVEGGKRWFEL